eukprot:gene18452-20301_t
MVKSRTAELWLQYIDYFDLLKQFIRAERTGNWVLHLAAISQRTTPGYTPVSWTRLSHSTTRRPILGRIVDCPYHRTSYEVGEKIQITLDGKALQDASAKRKDMVRTLENLKIGVIIEKETIHINRMVLFARLMLILQRETDPAPYFSYELKPIPTALFKEGMTRKANKSLLTKALINKFPSYQTNVTSTDYVLDRGVLLHRVRWLPGSTYDNIISQHQKYIIMKFGRCHIVFDRYASGANIKDHEHQRRMLKTSADIQVDGDFPAFCNQTAFLLNNNNKMQFIQLLGKALERVGHHVVYSNGDADTLIASTALEFCALGSTVSVVADDTDVLILLLYHWNDKMAGIFFYSEAKRDKNNIVPLHSIKDISVSLGNNLKVLILFIHAWSVCDTTSSIYGIGKLSIMKKLKKSKHLRDLCSLFSREGATQARISEAGLLLFAACYGGNIGNSLDHLHYEKYMNMVATSMSNIESQRLPPRERELRTSTVCEGTIK